ncbi:hypothetical protein Hanom_Chr05g00434851 [Helianthus anomalus]
MHIKPTTNHTKSQSKQSESIRFSPGDVYRQDTPPLGSSLMKTTDRTRKRLEKEREPPHTAAAYLAENPFVSTWQKTPSSLR